MYIYIHYYTSVGIHFKMCMISVDIIHSAKFYHHGPSPNAFLSYPNVTPKKTHIRKTETTSNIPNIILSYVIQVSKLISQKITSRFYPLTWMQLWENMDIPSGNQP